MVVRAFVACLLLSFLSIGCAVANVGDPLQVADLTPVKVHQPPDHAPVVIVRDGQAVAQVYVATAEPSDKLHRLVAELIDAIDASTGATLERVDAMPAADQPAIIIGDCAASRALGIDASAIPVEGFVVRTGPQRIFIVGSTQPLPVNHNITDHYGNEGDAWGVADFLERLVGVRWYWPTQAGGRSVVAQSSIIVQPLHYSDAPVFHKRTFFPPSYRRPWNSRWVDKPGPTLPEHVLDPGTDVIDIAPLLTFVRSGSSWPYQIKVHQPQHFSRNPQAYADRKDMFQQRADGTPDYRMLCYTSELTLEYILQGCEDIWDHGKRGSEPWVTTTAVTVSPGDYPVRCHHERCKELFEPELAPYGTASRTVSLFVQRLCEEVNQRWPDKKVIYLPYWNYTICPPDIDYPGNLEIEMCTMAFGLMRQPQPRALMEENIRAWSQKVGGRITTWEYSHRLPEWTHAPVQYPHLVQDYYRANREALAGSFLNGGGFSEWSTAAPTDYCWMKVLWNPDVDIDAILDGLCERQFGAGADPARRLLKLMCDRWQEADWSRGLGDAGRITPVVFTDAYPPEVVERMKELRDAAYAAVRDDAQATRRLDFWLWTFEPFLDEARQMWDAAAAERQGQ